MSEVGKIGLCMAPGRTKKKKIHDWARDLNKDLDRIRNVYHCDVLVSLVRKTEMEEICIPNLFKEVVAREMDYIHFPIKDKWVPSSMEDLVLLVDRIINILRKGKTVVVHCNGGKGRSGTVLVATLVGLGRKVQQAIDVVRKTRSGTIRNPLQIAYVKRFKTAWKQHQEAQVGITPDSLAAQEESLPKINEEVSEAVSVQVNRKQTLKPEPQISIMVNSAPPVVSNTPTNASPESTPTLTPASSTNKSKISKNFHLRGSSKKPNVDMQKKKVDAEKQKREMEKQKRKDAKKTAALKKKVEKEEKKLANIKGKVDKLNADDEKSGVVVKEKGADPPGPEKLGEEDKLEERKPTLPKIEEDFKKEPAGNNTSQNPFEEEKEDPMPIPVLLIKEEPIEKDPLPKTAEPVNDENPTPEAAATNPITTTTTTTTPNTTPTEAPTEKPPNALTIQ
uniref:protein-tyrosine-phosphatase n=1 Tax=Arcella intermedia TaxID=1963864 RepID=A0A6B2L321_9EUKA